MRRWQERLHDLWPRAVLRIGRDLPPRAILMLGFALFVLYAFPGYMSTDSVAQLEEARRGVFSDGHPPLMAAEWWVLDRIISGPILMLLLQGSLFLGGLYVLFQRLLSPRAAAWTAIGILLFPPVLTVMAVIWKDSQMAAYLVAGTAALIQPSLRTRILGLALLALACASRHNGFAAAVPIVFFVFEWRSGIRWWKRVAVAGGVVVVLIGAAFAVSRVLTSHHVTLTPVFADIVDTIACTDERSDEDLRHLLRGTPLAFETGIQARARKLVEIGGSTPIVQGEYRLFSNPETPEQWAALNRARKELVLDDPIAYLAGHWVGYSWLLGLYDTPLRGPVWNLFLEEDVMVGIQHYASWSGAQLWISRVFYWLADYTPLFRPFVYALVALALLALCCRDRLTAGLLTSGLLYELSFFPAGANPDYRYSHWMVTSTCIAIVFLFVQRKRTSAT